MMVELPPVHPNLLRLVDRTDQQTDSDRDQLDFRERHLDVARHDEALVEHAVENVDQPAGAPRPLAQWRHRLSILRELTRAHARFDCRGERDGLIAATKVPLDIAVIWYGVWLHPAAKLDSRSSPTV